MARKPNTAPAVRGKAAPALAPKAKPAQAEMVVERLFVPVSLLLAAETVAGTEKDGSFRGVHLELKDERVRVVATNGSRMFVGTFALPEKVPSWLKAGVTLSEEGLKARLGLLSKLHSKSRLVRLDYVAGMSKVQVSDPHGNDVFSIPTVAGDFPDVDKILSTASFSLVDADKDERAKDWQPLGINSSYLKHIGEVAKLLGTGLDKGALSKQEKEKLAQGMVVRSFNSGRQNAPLVFDFSMVPGALLIVMPERILQLALPAETARMLSAPAKGTMAALKAHGTRWRQKAEDATNEEERQEALTKADEYAARLAYVQQIAGAGLPALEGPASEKPSLVPTTLEGKAEPEPKAEQPEEPEAEPEEDLDAQVAEAEEADKAEMRRGMKAAAASVKRQPSKAAPVSRKQWGKRRK